MDGWLFDLRNFTSGVIILAFSAGLGAFVLLEMSGWALDGIEGFASAIKRCTFESNE